MLRDDGVRSWRKPTFAAAAAAAARRHVTGCLAFAAALVMGTFTSISIKVWNRTCGRINCGGDGGGRSSSSSSGPATTRAEEL